jgi:hypothetical protein
LIARGRRLASPRAAIGCILNRLILLTGGNELKLAEVFARAELKRGSWAGRYGSDIGGLGNGSGTSPAARHAVVGCCPKTLVSIQLFFRHLIIVLRCGPIDLVTPYLCPLKCRQNRIWRPASPMRT